MKHLNFFFFLIIVINIIACSDEDDCAKNVIVQKEFTISTPTGTTIIPEIRQTVDCSFPNPNTIETITQLPKLNEFSYEILEFNFTPDNGNNNSRLQFKIKLKNTSNKLVKGLPYITSNIDGIISSTAYKGCTEIPANSNCVLEFDKEQSLNIGIISSYKIVKVEYLITQ